MWIIAKVKLKECFMFKKNLKEAVGEQLAFYQPKILQKKFTTKNKLKKNISKFVLGSYIFCKSDKFFDKKFVKGLAYVQGLKYFLSDCQSNQKEISDFIDRCKNNEDCNGS